MNYNDVGINIKKIRNEKGLTQKELAELSGVSEVSIRKYEAGDRNPKYEQLEKIAKALNCNLEQLCRYKKVTVESTEFETYVKEFSTGDKIKKYRKIKGITQEELAELIDVSDSQIRKYELGIRKPKYERMLEIAKALDILAFIC